MVWIRIFDTREEAEWGKKVLEEGGIHAVVSEDKFEGVTIQDYGVSTRFRLLVEKEDYYRAAEYLAKKLRAAKL